MFNIKIIAPAARQAQEVADDWNGEAIAKEAHIPARSKAEAATIIKDMKALYTFAFTAKTIRIPAERNCF